MSISDLREKDVSISVVKSVPHSTIGATQSLCASFDLKAQIIMTNPSAQHIQLSRQDSVLRFAC